MKKLIVAAFCLCMILLLDVPNAQAHGIFKKAIVAHYGFAKSTAVSCYACHARKADIPANKLAEYEATKNKKVYRNEFGKRIEKILAGKNITKQVDDAKAKAAANEAQAEQIKANSDAKLTEVFLEAFKKFEAMKSPDGPTWKELITSGKVDRIKP